MKEAGHEGKPGYGPPGASTSALVQSSNDDRGEAQEFHTSKDKKGKGKVKGKNAQPFDLLKAIHAAEIEYTDEQPKHRFEVTVEPASLHSREI